MTVTEELQQVRELAREFAQSELRPNVERWDHDASLDDAVLAQVAELGFFGMRVPEAFGGMGFDMATYASALEVLAWGEPAVALTLASSAYAAELLLASGSDAQKREWLEPIARGEVLVSLALAERDGAQPARAARDGDAWRLSGRKAWVSNARTAAVALVSTRGDLADEADGGGAIFLVRPNTAGVAVGPRATTMGLRPLEICDVEFRDVAVPDDARIPVGEDAMSAARRVYLASVAAMSVGIAQAALEHALAYAAEREQFGTRLRRFEAIQFKLADMAARVSAARGLVDQAAASDASSAAAIAKVFASEAAMWVTTQAVQIFGGYGYMRDYPVEKLMRDAKAMELLASPNDVLRTHIADALYES